ncbi:palmitoyl-protein thioesterase ABHD10, mitochondrial-like isoform X2 [Scyliorhinus canicula]|uniref:palmitoyl-protein thioesterase ABHD10, mitochondrial-like isoform X2 n=1 Tax=Scyliorhinus canicula TaxID=7830 RepID=UPI0018F6B6E5|nr:palmitoyl-protein thioesterase ABHD10, mitochondrial-like isoform X2 [Scyliorhinus canicula]
MNNREMSSLQFLTRLSLPRLAYHRISAQNPGVVFLSGYMSSMNGEKAVAVENFCRSAGYSFVRFDYTGCGGSEGVFKDCLLRDWKNDVLSVLDNLTTGPQILVGSSMGGWLMLLACLERPERVAGMVGIATAADHFVTALNQLPSEVRMEAEKTGQYTRKSRYIEGGVYTIQYGFVKEAEEHCILQSSINISCPVRLIHSMKDEVVPWQTSIKVAEQLASDDVDVILRKGGEHRMSQSDDLKLLVTVVEDLLHRVTRKELK